MNPVHFIPILTTCFSLFFLFEIGKHYLNKTNAWYLLWWCIGVLTFGVGTFTESYHAIFGYNETNTRFWYVSGALLGGFPLAQGTVYLLLSRRRANLLSIIFSTLIVFAGICVFLSPVGEIDPSTQKLTGKIFSWTWVRKFSPFVNIYSLIFLVGGAIYSARLYKQSQKNEKRWLGNIFIAAGGLLPGIGGTFTRYGYVEVLFVTELIGLVFIYSGYRLMRGDTHLSVHENQNLLQN